MKVANPSCSDNADCALAGTKLKAASGWNSYSGYSGGDFDNGDSAYRQSMDYYGEYAYWGNLGNPVNRGSDVL